MTRIAVPIVEPKGMESEVNEHFGMSEYFEILEVDGDQITSHSTLQNNPTLPGHKPAAQFLIDHDVRIVLAGGIGPHMIQILLDGGVRIFKGAAGTVQDAVEDYKAGMLTETRTVGDME